MTPESRYIAMLIDGDNAQPSLIGNLLAEAAKYGVVAIRRIYGDWTTPNMNGWRESLNSYAVLPVQQFRYTTGKNATDSALIIEAMDLLHAGNVGGFCIVSSDSDYTRLATRIREQGLFAMGIGRRNTPQALVNACEVFVHTENLTSEPHSDEQAEETPDADWIGMVESAIESTAQDDGWAYLAAVGEIARNRNPAFDPRSYGHSRLYQLVQSAPSRFETKGGPNAIQVRVKPS